MSLFNLRRRQIDVDKQMPVLFGEIPEAELDSSHTRGTVEVNVSRMPAEERGEVHLREILGNARSGNVEAIPTPHMTLVPTWNDETDQFPLQTPSHYIRWSDIESNVAHIEYDADEEDEAWLSQLSSEQGLVLSEDDFEYLIDFLEKQEYLYPMLKLKLEKASKEVRADLRAMLPIVHDYWRAKVAARGGKPLLRRFLNHGAERLPYTAFSEKLAPQHAPQKKQRTGGVLTEDPRAVARLQYIRSQFMQVRLILHRILQREETKREKVRLTQHVLELLVRLKGDPKLVQPQNTTASLAALSLTRPSSALPAPNGAHSVGTAHHAAHHKANHHNAKTNGYIHVHPHPPPTAIPPPGPIKLASSNPNSGPSTPRSGARVIIKTSNSRASTSGSSSPSQAHGTPNYTPIPAAGAAAATGSPRITLANASTNASTSAASTQKPSTTTVITITEDDTPKILMPEPAKLEGEYALNPWNLLRAYPFIGGTKRGQANQKAEKEVEVKPEPEKKKDLSPFSSADFSPFFDPLTGQRFDSLEPSDAEVLAMEEMDMECEEDEEDELIQNIQQNMDQLIHSLPPSCKVDQNGLVVYHPADFKSPDVEYVYDPTDSLVRWQKQDVSFLRQEWLDQVQSPSNLPHFASSLPNKPENNTQNPTPAPLASTSRGPLPARPARPHAKRQQYALPTVEPQMLPTARAGFHVYFPRPAVNGHLPPRRYQVKTNITRGTVNGLPYTTWSNVCDVPVSAFGSISDSEFSRKPNHDDFSAPSAVSEVETYQEPIAKRFKISDGKFGHYEVEASALAESLPETMYMFGDQPTYDMVDLDREGLTPFRGQKRIGRLGRVIWDRVPTNALDVVPVPLQTVRPGLSSSSPCCANTMPLANSWSNVSSMDPENPHHVTSVPSHISKMDLDAEKHLILPTNSHSGSTASDSYLGSVLSSMTATTTSPDLSSADAISGETTIANSSGAHSPDQAGSSTPHEGSSPHSKSDHTTTDPLTQQSNGLPHLPYIAHNPIELMDVPLSENLEDMPWL